MINLTEYANQGLVDTFFLSGKPGFVQGMYKNGNVSDSILPVWRDESDKVRSVEVLGAQHHTDAVAFVTGRSYNVQSTFGEFPVWFARDYTLDVESAVAHEWNMVRQRKSFFPEQIVSSYQTLRLFMREIGGQNTGSLSPDDRDALQDVYDMLVQTVPRKIRRSTLFERYMPILEESVGHIAQEQGIIS